MNTRTSIAILVGLLGIACGGAPAHTDPPPAAPPVEAPPPVVEAPPPPPVAQLQDNRIVVGEIIRFEENSEALHGDSNHILDEVATVINAHSEIQHLRIEGNTDNLGAAEHNQHLSEARARSVAAYLHAHGVAATIDLQTVGYGLTRPLCSEDTDECRAQNRRVDFIIVDAAAEPAAPPAAAPPPAPAHGRGHRPATH